MNMNEWMASTSGYGGGDDATETAAAKVKAATVKNPVQNLSRALLRLTSTTYETFRHCVAATFFNSQVQEALGTHEVQPQLLTSLDGFTAPATKPALLRDRIALKPGDGSKTPMVLEFYEYVRVTKETLDRLIAVPAGFLAERVEILDYLTKMEAMGQTANQQKILDADREELEDKHGYVLYNGFLKTYINVRTMDTEGVVTTLEFKVSTEIDPGAYVHVIKADRFSSYLVHLWAHTVLSPKYRGGFITDPRIAAAQSATMQGRFRELPPKTDERGFGVYANGMPIYIPKVGSAHLSAFMDKADMCVDEDGYFSKKILVETHAQHNKVVYVDWLNDIMAYTSNTGTLSMINLGDVVALDRATEYSFLDTPLNSGNKNKIIHSILLALDRSLNNVSSSDAAAFATDDDTRRELDKQTGPAALRVEVLATAAASRVGVTLFHFAGQNHRELVGEDMSMLVPKLRAYQCYVKAWVAKRAATRDENMVAIPKEANGQNVLWRLQGFEYVVHSLNAMTDAVATDLKDAWLGERNRRTTDPTVRTFDIPNMHVGKGGLEGFLPHQGRILSSKAKVPSTSIDPVSTGGGKTILTVADLLLALKANPKIRGMITTKGRLVKGTITEINAVTKGKVNAIPLRPIVLFRMKKFAGVNSFAVLKKWFDELPPNTIFVNSYSDYTSRRTIYEDIQTVDNFANMGLHDTQYLAIIKLLGFDMMVGDESHMIKNPEANRSTASYSVFTRAGVRRITSGTVVSNTVKDVIGQARAITPAIFGTNVDDFAEMYDVSTGLIQDDETAELIVNRMRAFSGYHEATREDWSYMLPTLLDRIAFSDLTPLQAEYYSICMQEAEMELLRLAEAKEKVPSGDGDDDEDEKDDDDDINEEEAAEEAFLEQAKFVLQRVEMFLVSPETDERYINWKVPDAPENHPKPTGRDLISPKIAQMDRFIQQHITANRGAIATNKIIVFGVNKVASQHFMKYSQFAGNAIHYTAGNEEAVRRFATDPNQFLLVADETALREGENLQMVSLILRQQAVWSPGDHEQAVARMYRPDPRGRYNRDDVTHIWCMTRLPNGQPSLDGIKVARLASKTVSNARMVYYRNPSWRSISNQFEDLSMLRMNPTTLFSSTMEDMAPYWDAWSTFNRWEGNNNLVAKRRAAAALQAKYPDEDFTDAQGNITNVNTFIRLSMFSVTSKSDLPGSRRVYCPWVINATPPDPKGYGFEILGKRVVPVNTVVLCEYGPAIVEKVKEGTAIIYTLRLSNGAKMNIPGGAVAAVLVTADDPTSGARYKEFAAIVRNPTAWAAETFFPIQTVGVTKASGGRAARPAMNPEDIEEITDDDLNVDLLGDNEPELLEPESLDDEPEATQPELDVVAGIVNTMPALIVPEDRDELQRVRDWHRVDPYVSVKFRTWDAVQAALDALYNGNSVHMSDEVYDTLIAEKEALQTGRTLKVGARIDNSKLRNFLTDQRGKLGMQNGKVVVKPYFLVFDLEVRLAFDIDSHAPALINYLLNKFKAKIPGIAAVTRHDAMWINTFNNAAELRKDLTTLMQAFNIRDLGQINAEIDAVMEELNALAKPRRRTF